MKLKILIVLSMLSILLTACGLPLRDVRGDMVEGSILSLKVKDQKLFFSFATNDGYVFDNVEYSRNYEIKIDEKAKIPSLQYEIPFLHKATMSLTGEILDEKKEPYYSENKIHSDTKILIRMNKSTYKKLFKISP